MDPKFVCPFCGKERRYLMAPRSVTIYARIYFKATDTRIPLNNTFCDTECLFAYIAQCEHAD